MTTTSVTSKLSMISWRALLLLICALFLSAQLLGLRSDEYLDSAASTTYRIPPYLLSASSPASLVPGELPGYTGWARPERTLAGYFRVLGVDQHDSLLRVTVLCSGHDSCQNHASRFFLRAYGPAVVPGVVYTDDVNLGMYTFGFRFFESGRYTVEAVLTFSDAPDVGTFPLPADQQQPGYEGYLLPRFPMILDMHVSEFAQNATDDLPLCGWDDLSAPDHDGPPEARWRVKERTNGAVPTEGNATVASHSRPVSDAGYKHNVHSTGIHMSYEYRHCQLLPRSDLAPRRGADSHALGNCRPTNVLFVGDSVLRVQRDAFDRFVARLDHIQTDFLELYGGFRRHEAKGGDLKKKLKKAVAKNAKGMKNVILFNTGLHDIHRLCGQEWTEDRETYMNETIQMGNFSCLNEYGKVLEEFIGIIQKVPSTALMVFQTTTSAWPKYGNFGIEWPTHHEQALPLDASFAKAFNQVAMEIILSKYNSTIHTMDGYWITQARPDNREVGNTGMKLSHPGLEVQVAMARTFATIVRNSEQCNVE